MSIFRFKRFAMQHDRSAMKIGTDAILLGAWSEIKPQWDILDVGCGCGLISLMLAQRGAASVHAIDLHNGSISDATDNFCSSPWSHKLSSQLISYQDIAKTAQKRFDLIISNPPFFQNDLKSSTRNPKARHAETLSFADILNGLHKLLEKDGHFDLILPVAEAKLFESMAKDEGYFLNRLCNVHTKCGNDATRRLMSFSKNKANSTNESICIRTAAGDYTEEFRSLTSNFYLQF